MCRTSFIKVAQITALFLKVFSVEIKRMYLLKKFRFFVALSRLSFGACSNGSTGKTSLKKCLHPPDTFKSPKNEMFLHNLNKTFTAASMGLESSDRKSAGCQEQLILRISNRHKQQ